MDKTAMDFIANEVYTMIQTRYRFMGRRWWMIKNGKWTNEGVRDSLIAQIISIGENTSAPSPMRDKIRRDVGMMYVVDKIIARLSSRLHVTDGLPARDEAPERLS